MSTGAQIGGAFQPDGDYTLSGTLTGGNLSAPSLKTKSITGQGATRTLLATESGAVCLFDRAAGIVYTLPAPSVGLFYDFFVSVTITSNAATVITDAATTFVLGTVAMATEATTPSATAGPKNFSGDGSTHIKVTMNGTTTGAIKGTWFRVQCISATVWLVTGIVEGSGTIATPFST